MLGLILKHAHLAGKGTFSVYEKVTHACSFFVPVKWDEGTVVGCTDSAPSVVKTKCVQHFKTVASQEPLDSFWRWLTDLRRLWAKVQNSLQPNTFVYTCMKREKACETERSSQTRFLDFLLSPIRVIVSCRPPDTSQQRQRISSFCSKQKSRKEDRITVEGPFLNPESVAGLPTARPPPPPPPPPWTESTVTRRRLAHVKVTPLHHHCRKKASEYDLCHYA